MLIWAIVATVLFIGSIFVILNLLKKYENLEEDSETFYNDTISNYKEIADLITFVDNEIRAIDKRGSFEADDEVGFFFKKVKELNSLLVGYLEYFK